MEGEDLMAGGGGNDEGGNKISKKDTSSPMELIEDALERLELKNETDYIKLAAHVSANLNRSTNSTNVVQFLEFLIKAVKPTLDSAQFKSLSSACNVQKNLKQKEEQVGKKKKKKSKSKKILKTQSDDAFMDCAGMEDYGW